MPRPSTRTCISAMGTWLTVVAVASCVYVMAVSPPLPGFGTFAFFATVLFVPPAYLCWRTYDGTDRFRGTVTALVGYGVSMASWAAAVDTGCPAPMDVTRYPTFGEGSWGIVIRSTTVSILGIDLPGLRVHSMATTAHACGPQALAVPLLLIGLALVAVGLWDVSEPDDSPNPGPTTDASRSGD